MIFEYEQTIKKLKIILASQSKGRKQLLENLGLFNFDVHPSDFQENLDKSLFKHPKDYVLATCQGKRFDLIPKLEQKKIDWDILIFCDTICEIDGIIIEKAQSKEEIAQIFKLLNGKKHYIHTAVNLVAKNKNQEKKVIEFIETTELEFTTLSEKAIQAYIEKEDQWRGRAGGYGIQEKGMSLFKSVNGYDSI